jgi:hypothetical protein
MIRYNTATGQYVQSDKQDAFLNEIIEVCKKHGMSISHQDNQGSFLITKFNHKDKEWLLKARDSMGPPPEHVTIVDKPISC